MVLPLYSEVTVRGLSPWVFVSQSGFNCNARLLLKIQMNSSDVWDFAVIEWLNISVCLYKIGGKELLTIT